jgi:hypothetical protein
VYSALDTSLSVSLSSSSLYVCHSLREREMSTVFKEGPGLRPVQTLCACLSLSVSHTQCSKKGQALSLSLSLSLSLATSLSRYVSLSLPLSHVHTVFTEGPDGMLVMAEWARKENEEV